MPLGNWAEQWIMKGRLLKLGVVVWLLFIGGLILIPYRSYFPPNFSRGFLLSREAYFYGLYAIGFYAHIISAPLVLVLGIIQSSRSVRRRWVALHQKLGQLYCVLILGLMVPGGFIMSMWAIGGWPSMLPFMMLSLLTWWFTFAGWRSIGTWNTALHGRYMQRSFLLVCSAILLRALAPLASRWPLHPDTSYAIIAWLSWLPSWLTYELIFCRSIFGQIRALTKPKGASPG